MPFVFEQETPADEGKFQAWYKGHASRLKLAPNPDDPEHKYDYRAAFKAGATPDAQGHWPSVYKAADHPNRIVNGVDTITGQPAGRFVFDEEPPKRNPASAPVQARDTSIIGRAKEAVSSGVQSAGQSLLDVYRALDPTEARSLGEAGMAPIMAASSPGIFAGELAGETARKASEDAGPNTSAAIGTAANLIAGILTPVSPIRARTAAGNRMAGAEAERAAARQQATRAAGIEGQAQQLRRVTPALESPEAIARREQIMALERQIAEAEQLRQSPRGRFLLEDDLRLQEGKSPQLVNTPPVIEMPGEVDPRAVAIERQLGEAEQLRQSPRGKDLLVSDLLAQENAARAEQRRAMQELFKPQAPEIATPRDQLPMPERFKITPAQIEEGGRAALDEMRRKPMRTPRQQVYRAAQDRIREITDTPADLEYKGKTYTGAVKEGPTKVRLKDHPDKVVRGPEQILQVEEKIPFDIPPVTEEVGRLGEKFPPKSPNVKEPWQMTRREFDRGEFDEKIHRYLPDDYFSDPKGTLATLKKPNYPTLVEKLDDGLELRKSAAGDEWAVFKGDVSVGYADTSPAFIVDPEFQRRGLGTKLMAEFKKARPDKPIGNRTTAGQNLTFAYHKRSVEDALSKGNAVPDAVRAEYPELQRPTFQKPPAGQQAMIPGAEARSVPNAPLRPKARQTEAPLELEQPAIRAKEPGLFEKPPWQMTRDAHAQSVGAPKPEIDLLSDSSAHQRSKMSDRARQDMLNQRLTDKAQARQRYEAAGREWEKSVVDAVAAGKIDPATVFDTDTFDLVSDIAKKMGFEGKSNFKIRQMDGAQKGGYFDSLKTFLSKQSRDGLQQATVPLETWQKTKVQHWRDRFPDTEYSRHSGGDNAYNRANQHIDAHKKAVQSALSEGKPVPPEVLAEYPDLKLKPTPTPEANLSAEEIAARDEMRGMLGGKKSPAPDWTETVRQLTAHRDTKPRPLNKLWKNPTAEQAESHAQQMREWNKQERVLRKQLDEAKAAQADKPRTMAELLQSERGSLTLPKLGNDDGTVSAQRLTVGGLLEESSNTLKKTMGEEGGKLATLSKAVRNDAEIEAGIATNRAITHGAAKLDAKQQDNLVDVLEGKAKPMDEDVAAVFKVAREELDKVAARAKQVKLEIKNPLTGEKSPFQPRENYFPHMFGQELGEYIKDPRSRALVKERIRENMERTSKSGKTVTDTQVEQALQAMVKASRTRNNHLEIARVFDAPDYSRDPVAVLTRHFSDAYRRINIAEKFGPDLASGEELLTAIGAGKGDKAESFARSYFEKVTGTEKAGNQVVKEAVNFATNFQAFSKLGQAVISNLSQPTYTAVVAGAKNAAKGYRDAFTIRGKDFAEKTGAILNDTMSEFLKDAGARTDQTLMGRGADAVLKYTGFTWAERMNRTMAANTGKYFARETFDKLRSTTEAGKAGKSAQLRQTLEKMNVDVEAALQRGALNEADELKAGQSIVNRTQFKTDVTEIPLFWASDAGRLLTQFKKFQFKSGQMVKEEILKEAAKGNIKPLIRAAALLPAAGAAVLHSRDAIRFGQQREKDAGIADYLATVGTFGAFTDAFAGSGRQPVRGLSYLAGPTLGDAGSAWEAVTAITQKGDVKPMAKLAVRQVPVVGPSLRQLFSDEFKKQSPRTKLMKELGIGRPNRKKQLEEMGLR